MMSKKEILETFKAGFELGDEPFKDNLLISKDYTFKNKAVFQAYDANMFPSPDFSTFNIKYQEKLKTQMLQAMKPYNLTVFIDNTKIKSYLPYKDEVVNG